MRISFFADCLEDTINNITFVPAIMVEEDEGD